MAVTHTSKQLTQSVRLYTTKKIVLILRFSQLTFHTSFGSFDHCYRHNNYLLNLFGAGR